MVMLILRWVSGCELGACPIKMGIGTEVVLWKEGIVLRGDGVVPGRPKDSGAAVADLFPDSIGLSSPWLSFEAKLGASRPDSTEVATLGVSRAS